MSIFDSDGCLRSFGQIKNELAGNVIPQTEGVSECPVGSLTSWGRDSWAEAYAALLGVVIIRFCDTICEKFFIFAV